MICVKMNFNSKIYIAGHNGMVGSSIVRNLKGKGYNNIIVVSRSECDLRHMESVNNFFAKCKPEYVFLAAAKCGGIEDASKYPVNYLFDNLKIQNNIIESSYKFGVKKLLFVGSASVYPKNTDQPIKEESILSGNLESANQWYGVAKITGIKLCEAYNQQYGTNFISANPCNIYGPNDNFDPQSSHVVASLIRKIHEAKILNSESVECWGTGNARREFIYVDDLADALIHIMNNYDNPSPINVGIGVDTSIKELVKYIIDVIGYDGKIYWNKGKPEGVKQRLLDVSKLDSIGWKPKTSLDSGLYQTYEYFIKGEKKCIGL